MCKWLLLHVPSYIQYTCNLSICMVIYAIYTFWMPPSYLEVLPFPKGTPGVVHIMHI